MRRDQTLAVDLAGRRVLVVEDSEDNQLLVQLLLTKRKMHVEFAGNGQEALAQVTAHGPYDFIIMDMQMPIMDGYAATAQLRRDQYRGPIIALTAHAMKEDRARCLNAGCDEYLTKPIDSKALFAVLEHFVRVDCVEPG